MRAAIYYAPPSDHPLSLLAARWLGRDAWSGAVSQRGEAGGFDQATLAALTAEPRGYGFHATLKPPFRFAEGTGLDGLRQSLAAFCRGREPVVIDNLTLARLGLFFALVPGGEAEGLSDLAAAAVRDFEPFRAPLSAAETARRRPERLSERQREYLATWGYPYVFEEFRFHLTLTGPVPEDQWDRVESLLRSRLAAFIGRPLPVDTICIFVQPQLPGDFVVDTAIALGGPAA
jgi:putative phosphonate metabolism protein